jgi:hypothetical protein
VDARYLVIELNGQCCTDIEKNCAIILLVDSVVSEDLVVQSLRGSNSARHDVNEGRLDGKHELVGKRCGSKKRREK